MIPSSCRLLRSLIIPTVICGSIASLSGCTGPAPRHPAIGATIDRLPLLSLVDPSRRPPAFLGRVTLLNFWGTWCPPCRRELPGLVRLANRLRDEPAFQLVAISCGGRPPEDLAALETATRSFLDAAIDAAARNAIEPWADPDGLVRQIAASRYGFDAFPTTYLVGPDATIRHVWVGYRPGDETEVARALVPLLREAKETAATAGAVTDGP